MPLMGLKFKAIGVAAVTIVIASSLGVPRSSTALAASGKTSLWGCAYSTSGRFLGCLQSAYDCQNLFDSRRGRWLFIHEDIAPKELNTPPPRVAAEQEGTGTWRVVAWPSRRLLGRTIATNSRRTRWKITDKRGIVARAEGSDGPLVAMVLLRWGSDVFC